MPILIPKERTIYTQVAITSFRVYFAVMRAALHWLVTPATLSLYGYCVSLRDFKTRGETLDLDVLQILIEKLNYILQSKLLVLPQVAREPRTKLTAFCREDPFVLRIARVQRSLIFEVMDLWELFH